MEDVVSALDAIGPDDDAQNGASETRALLENDIAALQKHAALLMVSAALLAVPLAVLGFLPPSALSWMPIAQEGVAVWKQVALVGSSGALALAVFAERMHSRASRARRRVQVPSGL